MENPGRAENLAVIGSGISAAAIDVMDQHKTEEAIAEFRKAIELCPAMRCPTTIWPSSRARKAKPRRRTAKELGAKRPD